MKNAGYKKTLFGLLGVHTCWAVFDLFIATFLTAEFLYKTDGDFGMVAIFNLIMYAVLFLSFFLFAYVCKRYSRVWCIRGAIAINIILVCLICFLNDKLVDLYLVFAVLSGLACGIFWIGINSYTSAAIGTGKMIQYQAYFQIIQSAAKIIFPFTLGAIIFYVSFFIAAVLATGVGVILVIFTLFLRETRRQDARFNPGGYFNYIKREKIVRPIMHNFAIQFLRSFWGVCAAVCVVVLIAIYFGDSFSLGWLTSVFAAGAIVVVTIYRFIRPGRIKTAFFLSCAVLCFVLSLGLLFSVDKATIILFQLGSVVFIVVPNVESAKLQIDVMKELGHDRHNTESIVFIEFGYFISRVIGMGLILIAYYFDAFLMFRILAVVFAALTVLSFVLVKLWYRAYSGEAPRGQQPSHPPAGTVPQLPE